jgi:ADP-ribose pyrophosphatase YjhB (NUDIX family)
MKIYSLTLSLDFRVDQPKQSYHFEPISWSRLEEEMRHGQARERQFYVRAEPQAPDAEALFALQADPAWRASQSSIALLFADPEQQQHMIQAFTAAFTPRLAAGGLVINEREEYCCIYHRGCWTLPKGHVDPGETIEAAALREVQEETGLEQVYLSEKMGATYHTFEQKGKWILKTTHWYRMSAPGQQALTPQAEEHIEAVAWKSKSAWLAVALQSYPLTRELFEAEFARDL